MTTETFLKDDMNAIADSHRQKEYQTTLQPFLLGVQLGTHTAEQLKAAKDAIDAKYPYATEDLVVDTTNAVTFNLNEVLK